MLDIQFIFSFVILFIIGVFILKKAKRAIGRKEIMGIIITIFALFFIDNLFNHQFPNVKGIWEHLFPDVRAVKTICMYPEKQGQIQKVSDYMYCLEKHNVKAETSDIRKMCDLQAQEENYSHPEESVNDYYLSCVRSEGLPN